MGQINAGTITTGTIVNDDIAAGAGIDASKLKNQSVILCDFGYTDAAGSIAVQNRTVFKADGAGTIVGAKAFLVDSGTNTDIDFDVQKNGSSILSAVINLTHSIADGTSVAGTVTSGSFVAGDIITCTIETVTQNTGALAPRVQIRFNHDYVA